MIQVGPVLLTCLLYSNSLAHSSVFNFRVRKCSCMFIHLRMCVYYTHVFVSSVILFIVYLLWSVFIFLII